MNIFIYIPGIPDICNIPVRQPNSSVFNHSEQLSKQLDTTEVKTGCINQVYQDNRILYYLRVNYYESDMKLMRIYDFINYTL